MLYLLSMLLWQSWRSREFERTGEVNMRRLVIFLSLFAVAPAGAANAPMPDFDSGKTCQDVFGQKGTRPSAHLLKICLQSEQKHYNLSRTGWEYLTDESAHFCETHVDGAIIRARAIRRYNYPGLVDPYTELWLCVSKRMKLEEAKQPPKPFQKW
jgi:hypothetical protein